MDEFHRIELVEAVERANRLIANYLEHIEFYRRDLDHFHHPLGRTGQRLGEPEPEGPRWRLT
jgi:hypothetical protein